MNTLNHETEATRIELETRDAQLRTAEHEHHLASQNNEASLYLRASEVRSEQYAARIECLEEEHVKMRAQADRPSVHNNLHNDDTEDNEAHRRYDDIIAQLQNMIAELMANDSRQTSQDDRRYKEILRLRVQVHGDRQPISSSAPSAPQPTQCPDDTSRDAVTSTDVARTLTLMLAGMPLRRTKRPVPQKPFSLEDIHELEELASKQSE